MKKQTYLRMTRKSPLRGFKMFKHKFLNRQGFLSLCARLHLVREVKNYPSHLIINNDTLNHVRLLDEKIKTERGVFNLSYRGEGKTYEAHWYYESLFKHKRLYTVVDSTSTKITVECRAECEEFEVHIDPMTHVRVNRKTPVISCFDTGCSFVNPFAKDTDRLTVTQKHIDFMNTRIGVTVSNDMAEGFTTVDEAVKECLNRARVQITNYIDGNSEAINERLTGVKYDGEFVSPDNQRLVPNTVCHRCGCPVFFSSVPEYYAQCLGHDEDLYSIETDKLDPIKYAEHYNFFKEELLHLTQRE